MVKLTIGNSYSKIQGLDKTLEKGIKELLSYSVDAKAAFFSSYYGPKVKYLIDFNGNFPTGLLYQVLHYLKVSATFYTTVDTRVRPVGLDVALFEPRNGLPDPYVDQLKAANKAALMVRGGIVMPTGSGKSRVIALIAQRLNVSILVVVPTLEIKQQLISSLSEAFKSISHITVENIASPKLKKLTNFDCLIIDECHHAAAKTYQKLNKTAWKGIYYRYFLTATFYRNQKDEQLLFEGIAGAPIFQLSQQEAVSKGYIVPVEAYYYDVKPTKTDAYTWAEVYSELVVKNDHRNALIADLILQLQEQSKATLCLVKEIAHGECLARLTGIPFANGQDETSRDYIRQFNSGRIMALIGTTGVLGEGVDTKPAEYVIIAGLGKAKSAFMQQVGRGVRTYPGKESCKVVLFRDNSHKFTLRHFKEQAKILKEELGVIITKL